MSLTVQFQLTNTLTPALEALLRLDDNREFLNQAAADAVRGGIQDHFQELEETNHATAERLGATPTGFWATMRAGTVARADSTSGTVSMPRQVAQRYFGGTLTPQNGSHYITLAAIAAAYGHRVADFPDLHFGIALNPFGAFQPAMVLDEAQKGEGRGENRRHTGLGKERTHQVVYFWLTTQVHQNADPDVLPTPDVMAAYAEHGAGEAIDFLLNQAGGAN